MARWAGHWGRGLMLAKVANTTVGDLRIRNVVRTTPETALIDVAILMRDNKRGAVVVEDPSGALLGIFTERDLVVRVDQSSTSWHGSSVSEFMTKSPQVIAEAKALSEAIRLMNTGGYRHLPIVNGEGVVTGILSIRDILSYLAEQFPQEFINLPPNPEHEASGRWGG